MLGAVDYASFRKQMLNYSRHRFGRSKKRDLKSSIKAGLISSSDLQLSQDQLNKIKVTGKM